MAEFKPYIKSGDEPELSENALTILRSRYLVKDENGECIETPGEMFARVAALVADALALRFARQSNFFAHASAFCLVFAVVSAAPAAITGLAIARAEEFVGEETSILAAHMWLGIVSLALGIAAITARFLQHKRQEKVWAVSYYVAVLIFVASMLLTGHYGGMLVHGTAFLSDIF